MKKLISFLVLAILVSSCGNKMTLMKRHYTKGYYFGHAGSRSGQQIETASKKVYVKAPAPEVKVAPRAQAEEMPVTASAVSRVAQTTQQASSKTYHSILKSNGPAAVITFAKPTVQLKSYDAALKAAEQTRVSDSVGMLILLVVIALFFPWLAVWIKAGEINKWFWWTLILWLLGFSVLALAFGGAFFFVAFLIAILYIFELIH